MSAKITSVLQMLEKDAGFIQRLAQGVRGFGQGVNQAAHMQGAQKALGQAQKTLYEAGKGTWQASMLPQKGFVGNMAEQARHGWQQARQGYVAQRGAEHAASAAQKAQEQAKRVADAERVVAQHSGAAAAGKPVNSQVAMTKAIPAASTPASVPANKWLEMARKGALPAAAGAGIAYAGYRGGLAAREQDARTRDFMVAREHNMTAPLPSMTVTASYLEFAEEKLAANTGRGPSVFPDIQNTMSKSLGDALATQLVAKPIEDVGKLIRKKFYDKPKQEATFEHVIANNPQLQKYHAEKPETLRDAYATLTKFSPSLAVDKNAVRSFLDQAMMSDGRLDFATVRMLAETEKFIQNSKGRGIAG